MSHNQPPPPGSSDGDDRPGQPAPWGPPRQGWGTPHPHPPSPNPHGQTPQGPQQPQPGGWGQPQAPWGQPAANPYERGGQAQGWAAPGTNPYTTVGGQGGPPAWQPGPRKGRTGVVVVVLVTLVVLLGGGIALAVATQDDDKDDSPSSQGEDPTEPAGGDTDVPSPDAPTSTAPVPVDPPTAPESSPADPGGPNLPDTGVDTTGREVTAADYQDNWEFKWEQRELAARHIVSRDLASCTDANPDGSLAELGCEYAVTATYVNERDKVRFTHVIFAFRNKRASAQVKKDEVITDKILDLPDDALWEDFDKGLWVTKEQDGYVVFTVATGPKKADEDKLNEYMLFANTDLAMSLYDFGF